MLTASNLKKFCYVILLGFFLALTQDNVLLNWKQSIKFEFSKASGALSLPARYARYYIFFTGQCIFPIRPIATDPLPQFHLISYTFYSLLKILQCKIKYKYYIEKIKMSFMPSYIIQTQQQVNWYFSALVWLWYRQLNALAVLCRLSDYKNKLNTVNIPY